MAKDELDLLRSAPVPRATEAARRRALDAALRGFDEKSPAATQGWAAGGRLSDRALTLWSKIMDRKLIAAPVVASLLALPIAGYATFTMLNDGPFAPGGDANGTLEAVPPRPAVAPKAAQPATVEQDEEVSRDLFAPEPEVRQEAAESAPATLPAPVGALPAMGGQVTAEQHRNAGRIAGSPLGGAQKMMSPSATIMPAPPPDVVVQAEDRDRLQAFDTNPVKSTLENPVSTFSIDVDTASYSFVRSSLKNGYLPDPDTVRVEEMVNYFPYDWKGPETAATPFNSMITVMPTPWNEHTKLMHVAIKGYDVKPAENPKSNLVFLIDTSGSMNAPDKLPLLKSAFRLLVDRMGADDTVSIVTYAGSAGTVLEPTKGSEKAKILAALDRLEAGGSTAGEAGIREAYRLAEESFVQGGVNRVLLATDGDFNVGQTSDDELKRLVETKRKSGVFLSVFGFGRGNYNDQMMQVLAQNGNGAAAYIDTLAEAEKTLVQEASSTLFPIAKDVKIQVEFNPDRIAEYRLIGYETRALKREDFNNDRVDAGDIGSGHSLTAIYEITPKGSPAQAIDDLRYGRARTDNPGGIANAGEYAFVKIRYKLPDQDVSKLIETPVTAANEIGGFDRASEDQRFSVAVAAFGQKLRDADQTAGLDWQRISEIASAARGADPFGYRAEFLQLVRLASALDASRR